GSSITGSGTTTMIGFLALAFAGIPMIQKLGLTLALGIFCILVATLLAEPIIILLGERLLVRGNGIKKRKEKQKAGKAAKGNMLLGRYTGFVIGRPGLVMIFVLLLTGAAFVGATRMYVGPMDYSDILPEGHPEIDALSYLGNEFGTAGDSIQIVIETDPQVFGSNEPRDIRTPEIVAYSEVISNKIGGLQNVVQVTDVSGLLKSYNNGRLPKTSTGIIGIMSGDFPGGQNPFENYVDDEYTFAVIMVSLEDMNDDLSGEFVSDVRNILSETPQPAGIKVGVAGDAVMSEEIMALVGPTLQSTSMFSLIGILVVVVLMFMSVRKGLISLLGLVFGIVWTYGLIGFYGLSLTSATSGSISMVMGVGIDFGIQMVNRFRQEREKSGLEGSLKTILNSTFPPMMITTLAALIGFRAMTFSEISIMADLGNIMSLGIMSCFLAAVLVIPVILVFAEKLGGYMNRGV
ncbi:MAG: efflux RND transporter permease subunit, partial [Candidatus Aenigmatarchaeota archaeon]